MKNFLRNDNMIPAREISIKEKFMHKKGHEGIWQLKCVTKFCLEIVTVLFQVKITFPTVPEGNL